MATKTYEITTPCEKVPSLIARLRRDPRYISHEVRENGSSCLVIAVFHSDLALAMPDIAVRSVKQAPKNSGKKKSKAS